MEMGTKGDGTKVNSDVQSKIGNLDASVSAGRLSRGERQSLAIVREVAVCAASFEGRWTMLALRRCDAALADRLARQLAAWREARSENADDEIAAVGRATIRGYQFVTDFLEKSGEAEDAYQFGQARNGTIVGFGESKASAKRIAERFPDLKIAYYTFDEAAELLSGLKLVSAVMTKFPGAEVTRVAEGDAK